MTASGADSQGRREPICVTMQHTEDTVHRLAKVQFNTYSMGVKVVSMLVSVILLLLGMSEKFGAATSLVLMALGCWTLTSMNAPARRNAKKIIAQTKGDLPCSEFRFEEKGITVCGDGKTDKVEYGKLYSLITDGSYLYLFLNRYSAYMIPLNHMDPADGDALKRLLQEKTQKPLELPGSLLRWNLGMLRRKRSRS